MEFFRKSRKGSITVLVVLILVPTIFFNGFLVDLARIKLYGNQALMAADNYGEAVLSYYDNVLKELYGLFAVTQDETALNSLKQLDAYVKSSFDPESGKIGWEYFKDFQDGSYNGFMPYKSADVQLSYTPIAGANLGSEDVLATQIGDFMKFRIVQSVMDDSSAETILEAIDTVKNIKDTADVIDKKNDLDKTAGELMELAQEYYEQLKEFSVYPDYLDSVQGAYNKALENFGEIADSDEYKHYYEYHKNLEEIQNALKAENALKEGEELSEIEKKYIKMYNDYQDDEDAREDKLRRRFKDEVTTYKKSWNSKPIDFDNYADKAEKLTDKAQKIADKIQTLKTQQEKLQETLDRGNVSQSVKDGMTGELEMFDKLFKDGSGYSADAYINLAKAISDRKEVNEKFKTRAQKLEEYLDNLRKAYIEIKEGEDESFPDMPWSNIDKTEWHNPFFANALYNSLIDSFEGGDDSEAKKKKKDAEKKQKEAEDALKKDEETKARDIPSEFNLGIDSSSEKFALGSMVKNAASYFKHDSLADVGNELLLKFYVTEYDFGMFSSRVTNVKSEKTGAAAGAAGGSGSWTSKEVKKSLTGYTMEKDINYLYMAELEYLFGGHNKSKDNLNEARNKILAFRAVVNYAATYSINEINTSIRTISEAAAAVNPLLGVAVSAALRLAVAGIETSADWTEMMKGESVNLLKTEFKHLTLKDTIADLVGCSNKGSGISDSDKNLKLSYEQYLMVMLLFMTTSEELIERTGNLITLNVNTVRQGIGKDGTLSNIDEFKTDKAVTAVNATCSVHLGFVVMPQGFAKQTLSSDTYAEVEEFQKNSYKFTVTRGY